MYYFISFIIGLTYFATCIVYTVVVAGHFEQIVEHFCGIDIDIRIYIFGLLLPTVAM
jgi:hypothetical protein